ncbi:unnamed protein product [Nezara viridula]|uniref:CHHC U11-48K-type domain-containing protein n=1 Tax=Nezara viridula TaxID=85310 RepID=A0A9P0MT95_NEZVI|nr:unnamed protein product [Nezara viridula]
MTSFHSSNDFLGFFRAVCVHTIILAVQFFSNCKNVLIAKQNQKNTSGVTAKEHLAPIHSNFVREVVSLCPVVLRNAAILRIMDAAEPTLICPYNKSHSIISSRMQFHLTKCRAQHPASEKAVCPFNSTHIVPKVELDYHIAACCDRIVLDSFTCKVGSSNAPKLELTKAKPLLIKSDENWEVSYHKTTCENRLPLEKFIYEIGSSQGSEVAIEPEPIPIEGEESWGTSYHKTTCPNRLPLEKFIYEIGSSQGSEVAIEPEPIPIEGEESWGTSDEPPVSVLEQVHETSRQKPTLHALIGAPKSERKAFRNQERLRIQRVLDQQGEQRGGASKKVESQRRMESETTANEVTPPSHNRNRTVNTSQANIQTNTDYTNVAGTSRGRTVNPRNPWGTRPAENIVASHNFPQLIPDNNAGPRPGTSRDDERNVPAASSSRVNTTRPTTNPVQERDPTNPWRVPRPPVTSTSTNNPSTSTSTNTSTTDAGEFPSLPVASRGRGRGRFKPKNK